MLLFLSACQVGGEPLTLLLGGDVMLSRAGQPIFTKSSGSVNPWQPLQQTGVINTQDLFFLNLESPLTNFTDITDEMNLCSNADQVELLVEGSVDLVSLANNHRDDCHTNGDVDSNEILKQVGVMGVRSELEPVLLQTPQGLVAVVAAETITGTINIDRLLAIISDTRQQADFVIVSMHWGSEYQAGVSQVQKNLAQALADAGADVIWGHHPHVLQRIEWLESSDDRQVLVIYSLGNTLADQWMLEGTQESALVRLYIVGQKITKINIIPIRLDHSDLMLHEITDQEEKMKISERLHLDDLRKQGGWVVLN